jgi:hypothetical protein
VFRGARPAIPSEETGRRLRRPRSGPGRACRKRSRAHTRLDEVLAEFRAAGLNQPVGSAEHASAADGGTTFALMLHGLAQHNAYHGGQLVLVRRAITGAA